MNKLRRPTLWLAIVFAAGIMLMPQRGAAKVVHDPFNPPPQLGDPEDPPGSPKHTIITDLRTWLLMKGNQFIVQKLSLRNTQPRIVTDRGLKR